MILKRKTIVLQVLKTLHSTKQFNLASQFLHQRFRVMLMAICFLCTITLLTASYFVIHNSIHRVNVVVGLLDTADFIDCFVRFWLMCHISDRMRQAVD